jgi:hypothetical protein
MIIDKNWDEIWKVVQCRAQTTQIINRQQWQKMPVAKIDRVKSHNRSIAIEYELPLR